MKCKYHALYDVPRSASQLCASFASKSCAEKQELINFFSFFWCDLNGDVLLMIIVSIIVIFFVIKFISITVEEYIAEGIEIVSEELHIPPALSSVTLEVMAFEAGELMGTLLASEMEDGVSYNLGALCGGQFFTLTIIVAIGIIQTKGRVRFAKVIFWRDMVMYLVALLFTLIFAFYGQITWWASLIYLSLYFILATLVITKDLAKKKRLAHLKSMATQNPENLEIAQEVEKIEEKKGSGVYVFSPKHVDKDELREMATTFGAMLLHAGSYAASLQKTKNADPDDKNEDGDAEATPYGEQMHQYREEDDENDGDKKFDEKEEDEQEEEDEENFKGDMSTKALSESSKILKEIQSLAEKLDDKMKILKEHKKKPIHLMTYRELAIKAIENSFTIVMQFTVLPADKEQYSRWRCLLYPIPGMIFNCCYLREKFDLETFLIGLVLGLILQLIFFKILPKDGSEPKHYIFMSIAGVLGAIFWLNMLSQVYLDMVEFIGVVLNLDKAFIGMVLRAIGNCMPDLITVALYCRQTEKMMIVSTAFTGQLFNILFGFGLIMLKFTLINGPQPFDLFQINKFGEYLLELRMMIILLITMAVTMIYSYEVHYRLKTTFAWILIGIYLFFIISSSTHAIRDAIIN
jgi:Ca2+/Na+ antiporter